LPTPVLHHAVQSTDIMVTYWFRVDVSSLMNHITINKINLGHKILNLLVATVSLTEVAT